MTQKERQAKSRQMIREAAESEFSASGYEAFTVDQLCARHGISKGMLYHYYTGKDQLFLLCVEDAFQGLEAYLRGQMGGHPSGGRPAGCAAVLPGPGVLLPRESPAEGRF